MTAHVWSRVSTLALPMLAACSRPCTWPNRTETLRAPIDLAAFRAGVTPSVPARAEDSKEQSHDIFLTDSNAWTSFAGLYDLGRVTLPPGTVEIRIWRVTAPQTVYSGTIIQKRGATFSGARLLFPAAPPDGCTGFAVQATPCEQWERIWGELLELGVMTLPDDSELGRGRKVFDGSAYYVELQADGRYRVYGYNNPDVQSWEEARRMVRIGEVVARKAQCPQSLR